MPTRRSDAVRTLRIALAALAFGASAAAYAAKPAPGYEAALPDALPAAPAMATGGIFNVNAGYAPLHTGNRASRVGDPLTILLVENTRSTKAAGSQTGRDGGFALKPPKSGPFGFLDPNALNASGDSSFKGQGTASQSNTFSSQLGVTIAEVRPNGTALVKGEKRLMLSQGEEWVQFSGIVRISDIDEDNRIVSSRVADARVNYAGKGSIQRAGREGWLLRFFNAITPF